MINLKQLKNRYWSFSNINSYQTCPRMFFLSYIDRKPQEENAFSQWGSLCHKLLESYYKGQSSIFDLEEQYKNAYKRTVLSDFPKNRYVDMNKKYYQIGLEYFRGFEDVFSEYQVVGVEQKIKTKIGEYNFVGVIDLILEKNGEYIICDHKSKGAFKNEQELRKYLFQLYLYSKYIYETYHTYPTKLIFNMFKLGEMKSVDFNKSEYEKALSWAEASINEILEEECWLDKVFVQYAAKDKNINNYKCDDFFCNNLCSVRAFCERSKSYTEEDDFDFLEE